ncbi:hypothetical protein Taro_053124 [Colocasia esculenta]|uniref:Uncharacterized protein n=1 Tax=Colocasia esculenta TaxID=4460 RepID=A0A843XKD5_COLES|nr:hypothetical protein [Colocasia esculenta]
MGPQLSRAVVVCGCVLGCDSLASLYRGGCRRELAAGVREGWTGLAVAGVCCRTVVVAACSPCIASSVKCEREHLYRELRVAFLQVLEVVSFPAGSECELQESVAADAGCACCERGHWFVHAAVGFAVGLHVYVGVSRRLREPTCGVAFTSARLWSAEPVEGVLALLAVPLLLGCVLVGYPLLVGVCPYWMSPYCWGVCCWLFVWPCMPVHRWALYSAQSTSLLELSRCLCAVLHRWLSAATPGCGASLGCSVFWCGFPVLLVVVLVRFALRTVSGLFLSVVVLPQG